jgi:cell division protein FtsW
MRISSSIEQRHLDYSLLIVTISLVGLGLTMVYSASAILARDKFGSADHYLIREIIYCFIGFGALVAGRKIPIEFYRQSIYPIYFGVMALLLLTMVPGIGVNVGGTTRWINLGLFSVQPSECAKVVIAMFMAYALAKKKEKIKEFSAGFLPIMLLTGILIAFVLAGKDLGNATVMAAMVFLMFFVAGTRLTYLVSAILLSLPMLYTLIISVDYRRRRILSFLNPWDYQTETGFQIIQSYVAFHAGSLFGQGLGEGKQKLFYLPAAHTDFILSVVGEELGLIGVLTVIILFMFLVYRAFTIAWRAMDTFSSYLALGIGLLFGLQVLINAGVVMGLLPTKGLTLPFISYGGTSLVMSLFSVGILLNISSRMRT